MGSTVGTKVGAEVGIAGVGTDDGKCVGNDVGVAVGVFDGADVGDVDEEVGRLVVGSAGGVAVVIRNTVGCNANSAMPFNL